MQIGEFAEVTPAEGTFKGEAVEDLEFAPANHTCCRFFTLLNGESAVGKVEYVGGFFKQVREDSFSVSSVIFLAAAIHEYVFLS